MRNCKYFIKLLSLSLLIVSAIGVSCMHSKLQKPEEKKPEENRFKKVVLAKGLDEPMQFEILNDGRVLFAERKGNIKVYNPITRQVTTIAKIPVRHTFNGIGAGGTNESEDGIQGVLLDPNFERNHYIYSYYAPLEGVPRNILVRFKWNGGDLDMSTEKILLEIPVDADVCCHIGGGMVFNNDGNLLLATGENAQAGDGFSTIDERSGRVTGDSQKSSANTNDLRGKIIRIHPEADGGYSIPKGNLFPSGTPDTRPEIYTMGNRNPWRLSVDSKTGWLYWGEVGPNGNVDDEKRGPRSYDEFNQARKAGNYGYPYFIGDNKAYRDYDFATGISGEKFNSAHPVNHSPNNTGMVDLPPAQSAFIWYPYAVSDEFPALGSGGSSAVGGPIYRRADFNKTARPFPDYYEGKWFITDWVRGWIMAVTMDEKGNYQSMERFLPELNLKGVIDMDFGPDGNLYILEYGNGVFKGNPDAQIVRIEYNDGNRTPIVQASANKKAGAVPLIVQLSAEGTKDYDSDMLSYEWKVTGDGKPMTQLFNKSNPLVTFTDPGVYKATLTVSDPMGATSSKVVEIIAGNEPPVIYFDFNGVNKSFFFPGRNVNYSVKVNDMEDGSLEDKGIDPSKVAVSIDYVPEGYDLSEIEESQKGVDVSAQFGIQLINKNNCKSCHSINTALIGPAFNDIAKKYEGDEAARDYIAKKIISGGSGVWGGAAMPPHPSIPENNAHAIAKYILGLGQKSTVKQLEIKGNYSTKIPTGESDKGSFVFRAAYMDRGSKTAPAQTSVNLVILRNPIIPVMYADRFHEMEINRHIFYDRSEITPNVAGAFLGLNKIDFTGIKTIAFGTSFVPETKVSSGWTIEVRIDSATGKLIGRMPVTLPAKDGSGNNAPRVKADIDVINGVHDVYFIFTTENVGNTKERIKIRDIKFSQCPYF